MLENCLSPHLDENDQDEILHYQQERLQFTFNDLIHNRFSGLCMRTVASFTRLYSSQFFLMGFH